jgi:hypothetical protein
VASKEDNRHDPEGKKTALKTVIADYNKQFGTNHDIDNFDLYYRDVQPDFPRAVGLRAREHRYGCIDVGCSDRHEAGPPKSSDSCKCSCFTLPDLGEKLLHQPLLAEPRRLRYPRTDRDGGG